MADPDNQVYRLSTIRDFWALGDADRMERAFKEIALGMVQAKRMMELLEVAAEHQQGKPVAFPVEWAEAIDWTDDGGKEGGFRLNDPVTGKNMLTMKHTLGPNFHDNAAQQRQEGEDG